VTDLDRAASEAGKIEGMANAEAGAPDGWLDQAVAAIRWVAVRYPFLITDDVWAHGLEKPREPRALGPCFKRAEKLGFIEATDIFLKTDQTKRHRAPVMVWRSRLASQAGFRPDGLYSRMGKPDPHSEVNELLTELADDALTVKVREYLAKTPGGLPVAQARLVEILRERKGP